MCCGLPSYNGSRREFPVGFGVVNTWLEIGPGGVFGWFASCGARYVGGSVGRGVNLSITSRVVPPIESYYNGIMDSSVSCE